MRPSTTLVPFTTYVSPCEMQRPSLGRCTICISLRGHLNLAAQYIYLAEANCLYLKCYAYYNALAETWLPSWSEDLRQHRLESDAAGRRTSYYTHNRPCTMGVFNFVHDSIFYSSVPFSGRLPDRFPAGRGDEPAAESSKEGGYGRAACQSIPHKVQIASSFHKVSQRLAQSKRKQKT